VISLLLAITSEQIGVGTASGVLIAFSAAVLRLYGQANDDRKESAEARVTQLEEELERSRTSYTEDRKAWAAEKKRMEAALELARQELRDCWQLRIKQRNQDDNH
jgi:mevalonate pyrophosphate decarboxylase